MVSGPQSYLLATSALQKQVLTIEVKSWRAPELVRVPLARGEYRRVNNNLMHAERVELVFFKQA
jgi:hypothetical protein